MDRRRLVAGLGVAGILLLGATGCSSTVAHDDVAAQIADQAAKQSVTIDGDVTCPEDLPAEVGKTVTCTFDSGGKTWDAEAKVTSVEGSQVKFDISANPRP